jgi:hypothetical protein
MRLNDVSYLIQVQTLQDNLYVALLHTLKLAGDDAFRFAHHGRLVETNPHTCNTASFTTAAMFQDRYRPMARKLPTYAYYCTAPSILDSFLGPHRTPDRLDTPGYIPYSHQGSRRRTRTATQLRREIIFPILSKTTEKLQHSWIPIYPFLQHHDDTSVTTLGGLTPSISLLTTSR